MHIGQIFNNRINFINMSKKELKAIEYEKETLPVSRSEPKDIINMELEEVIEYMNGRPNNKYYIPKNEKKSENENN